MKQEDKDLLLKDLCARLPYNLVVQIENEIVVLDSICNDDGYYFNFIGNDREGVNIEKIKPYLFPLSSMTEEQRNEFLNIQSEERKILFDALVKYRYEKEDKIPIITLTKHIDWLNAHHFDYRDLIPMGLANDATGLNIYQIWER